MKIKQLILLRLCKIYMWLNVLTASYQRKIEINHTLNNWDYPFGWFGGVFTRLPNMSKTDELDKYRYIKPIFRYLNKNTSKYDRLYYHNVVLGHYAGKMTPKEFDVWFSKNHILS